MPHTTTRQPDSYAKILDELQLIRRYGLQPSKREMRRYARRILRVIEAEHPEVAR